MKPFLLIFFIPFLAYSQVPQYYSGIDFTQTSTEIESDIAQLIISTHSHELFYTPEVWDALKLADLDPENSENVLLIYGFDDNGSPDEHRTRDKDDSCHTSSCNGLWVREHVYPKSLGTPDFETEGPGSDAHAIRAVDSQRNGIRSNRKFTDGEGDSHIDNQGFFFPGDEWKGDVARMMMYMHLRYGTRCQANGVAISSHNYNEEMPDIFLEWNVEDPVSAYELVRNEVLNDMQGNRNPFIDNPYLATMIWGGEDAVNTWPNMHVQDAAFASTNVYPNPTKDLINVASNKLISEIEIFSTVGMKLKSKPVQTNSVSLNLNELGEGIYFLLIRYSDNSMETKRIILN